MSIQDWPGGVISKTPVVPAGSLAISSASGMWSMKDVAYWVRQGIWPNPLNVVDPYFDYVSLLLNGDGAANGAQNNTFLAANGAAQGPFADPAGYWSNSFDGSGDYLTVPGDTSLAFGSGDFTIEMWINPSVSQNKVIYDSRPTTTQGSYPCIVIDGSNIQWYIGSTITISGGSLSTNTWYHIAVCRSGTSTKMFVNGTQVGSTYTDTNVYLNGSSRPAIASSGYTLNTDVFNGYISNVRAVKGTALYTSNFTVPTSPLTAISGTSLLTCQSNVICDTSSNLFAITANGNAAVNNKSPFTISSTYNPYSFSGYFDGSGDYLSVASAFSFAGDFTVECFVFTTGTTGGYSNIWGNSNITDTVQVYIDNSNKTVRVNKAYTSGDLITGGAVSLNTWNHIALTRSGSTLTLWLNGVSQGTSTTSVVTSWGSNEFWVGNQMTGYISNFRSVNSAIYTSNFTPSNTPLTAISGTSLLTCQSSTFVDNSPNAFTITVNGNTTVATASNSGLPITRNGNTTQGTFSPYGSNWSNYIPGYLNYLSITPSANLQQNLGDWTWDGFVYVNDLATIRTLLDCGSFSDQYSFVASVSAAGKLGFGWNTSTGWAIPVFYETAAGVITPNKWYHIAFVREGSTFSIYVDGVRQFTQGSISAWCNNTTGICLIGNDFASYILGSEYYPWRGYISNLRFVQGTALYSGATYIVPTTPSLAVSNTKLLTCQSNRFVDATGNFTISTSGSPSVQRFSPFNPTAPYSAATIGGSGYFDGTGDYLSLTTQTALNISGGNWTIECWVYCPATPSTTIIAENTSNGVGGWSVQINSSAKPVLYSSSILITGTNPLIAGQWNHVVFVRNGSTTTHYLNGASNGTSASDVGSTNGGLWIGARSTPAFGLSGYMVDFRVVKGTAVYTSNFTPPTSPLTAITNTSLLCNFTNAGIPDAAMMNDLETVGNAQVSTSVKKYGTGSLAFDGTGDYLATLGSAFALNSGDFTVEMWIYWTAIPTSDVAFVGGLNFGGASVGIYNSASNIAIISGGSTYVYFGSKNQLTTNQWNHLAITRSGNTHRCFINGVLDSAGAVTSTVNWGTPTTTYVGAQQGPMNYLNGYIDDLRITKGLARYTANFTPPTAALPTY